MLELSNGHFEVGVRKCRTFWSHPRFLHIYAYDLLFDLDIADVSHFVKHNDAVDKEACERGTTVYLIDKRIDMLPPVLGTSKQQIQFLMEKRPYDHVTRNASIIWFY